MTEYTDKQLNYALINSDYDHFLTVSSLRAILDALPEPQDEWQQCRFEDIQKGDRLKVKSVDGVFEYKSPIENVASIGDWLELQHQSGLKSSARISTNTFYRIPAPIVHPDPLKDEFIIAHEIQPKCGFAPVETKTAYVWRTTIRMYESVLNNGMPLLSPEEITSWKPAKAVADDDRS